MGKTYKDTNDAELLFMANEESEDAKDILFKKYYYIIEQAMSCLLYTSDAADE